MNNKELIIKIEEMDSNKEIMLEVLIEETKEYFNDLENNKIINQLPPSIAIKIDKEEYAIFYICNTKKENIDNRKSKYMEIFKIYKRNKNYPIDFNSIFIAYMGRDVYKWKNYAENLYCQFEEVEKIENIHNDWRYK